MDSTIPRVLYDHQIFSLQKYGGISRYFAELMMQYKTSKDVEFEVSCKYSDNYYLREIIKLQLANKSAASGGKIRKYWHYGLNIRSSRRIIDRGDYDVFHPTYYDPYFLKDLNGTPFVITVHDLTHDLFPQYFKNPARNTAMKQAILSQADKVIAISQNTKRDIIHIYNVPEEKISVIYHGNSLKSDLYTPKDFSLPAENKKNRYLLYVGLRSGYKNFDAFAKAVSQILKSDETLEVVCVGAGPFTKEENEMLNENGIENRFTQITAKDEELTRLYSNALALVFPSLYEGFGMPILEAMDCGCPAIVSNSSSMPEVGGEAACYFDPRDIDSIRSSIAKVVYDEPLRQHMILDGRKQAGKFSWQKTARETLMVYKSLL